MTTLVTYGDRLVTAGGRESWLKRSSVPLGSFGQGAVALSGQGRVVSYQQLYEEQPWVAVSVNKLARQVARLPLYAHRLIEGTRWEGESEPLGLDHPLARLLACPWPRAGELHLKQKAMFPALVHGNAALAVFREAPGGPPSSLVPLDYRYLTAHCLGGDGEIDVWETGQSGRPRMLAREDVLHFAWEGGGGDLGVSPLKQLGTTLRTEDAAQRYQSSSFDNGARPSGALVLPQDARLDADERQELREEIRGQHAGVDQQFKVALLSGGMDWKPFSHTAVEAELIEQRRLNREEVAAVYDIPPPLIGILDHATYCLPGDALVMTERGSRPISSIRAGDRVWAPIDGKLKLTPVSWSGQTGHKPLVTLRTQNRTLRCSDNHPVLVARPVDRRTRSGRESGGVRHEWVPAGQVARGDMLVTADELPAAGGRSCPTRDSVTAGFMEACGLLLGDGNIMRDRDGQPVGVSIARATGAPYWPRYREAFLASFARRPDRAGVATLTISDSERQSRFMSVSAARELDELGLGGTAHTKRVPEWVAQLAPDLRAAFVRGFADADGSVDKNGRLTFHSANEILVRQMRELCIGLGVRVNNVRAQRGWVTLPQGRRIYSVMWSFMASDPAANRAVIGSHDPRDWARMDTAPAARRRNAYPRKDGTALPAAAAGCGHARVVSVELGEVSVPVYDLEVPESRSFIAEGVVVHNSNVAEMHRMLYGMVLGPWLTLIEDTIKAQLIDTYEPWAQEGLFVAFDLGEVLKGDALKEIQAVREGIQTGVLTVNEGRRRLNMSRYDDPAADELLIPVNNLAPLGDAGSAEDDAPDGDDAPGDGPPRLPASDDETVLKHLERAGRVIASRKGAGHPEPFDRERFVRELGGDLNDRGRAEAVADLVEQASAAGGDDAGSSPVNVVFGEGAFQMGPVVMEVPKARTPDVHLQVEPAPLPPRQVTSRLTVLRDEDGVITGLESGDD